VLKATWFVVAGMAIVFATLGLLMLVLTILNHWLTPVPDAARGDARPGSSGAPAARSKHG
jgi:Na+-transporting methylmalonyl-CoA/oxaloacetate decarboxylase gamma subunit